ncbi:MAG TPA: MOSC N-terminal beta barrel domain-containing protein [Gaiellaceae bacterium]|nr:MOSC N-terminal beta barrel domain-containing protein [Gaiellaceae bacterium]HZT53408.1 MOSC N-terminal beta barrel domain-containing protein [Gaiellaceae bacterium]
MEVARLSIAPVKGLALEHPEEIVLGRRGATGDRRFHLITAEGRLVNAKTCGPLVRIRPRYDAGTRRLALELGDGSPPVEGEVVLGGPVETSFYGRPVRGRLVEGPWSEALSAFSGMPLQLVCADEPGAAVDRTHVVSLLTDGSLAALGRRAGVDAVDPRRFRMTVEVRGASEHEEDGWIGREVDVGGARIRVVGPVGRCAVTTLDPDSGVRDLDTLGVLAGYRTLREGKAFAFGVCGDVLEEGVVRIGDPVRVR